MPVLVSAAELAALLADPQPPRLLDVRWTLTRPDGRDDHAAGHLPGAVYVDLDTELASIGDPRRGRHPLPTAEAFQQAARRWGLRQDDAVVVYDDGPSFGAARAWWLLRHAGVADVRILDGGLAAWTAAGGPLEEGAVTVEPGDIALDWDRMPVTDADGAAAWPRRGILLDARASERFRGEVEPMDPVAGHIAGAVNAPTAANSAADGTFLTARDLAERFAQLGVDDATRVAVYCGSGVTAAHQIAALEIAGIRASLYPGSWSEWSNDPRRPAATGP
ncbi:sulfurtransferase [Demequina sp. SYSU T00039]|uniref:Sulfurtransferase n=1 Tax=Demequina lignilytica TaxID=3051663 RepID=A0AAW7M814_9MICO|nr:MULTISPECIES: sulfurtransferase [unclassified Demequina]MDN4477237.1 sulfurtransferase [Demequina sp. SYSU T00039-1]MDN4487410.1 sulfurtransferase [Demequina sp. SYSU T00039]MDN4491163.1 sulfurtransferase [Demequina sp. SYSU T00068]